MVLYDISYTTKKYCIRYDAKGKEIGRTNLDRPITMRQLPFKTTLQYEHLDDFKRTESVMEPRRSSKSKRKDWDSMAPATKKSKDISGGKSTKSTAPTKTSRQRAAESGDIAAAINAS